MDKRTRKIAVINRPKTSTPNNVSKKFSKESSKSVLGSPISNIEQIEVNTDKDSFIKSLQLITSDGSTDEERTDAGRRLTGDDKRKDSGDVSLASENNLSIEEYYWKSPFNNTSVHLYGLSDVSASKIHNTRTGKNTGKIHIKNDSFSSSKSPKAQNLNSVSSDNVRSKNRNTSPAVNNHSKKNDKLTIGTEHKREVNSAGKRSQPERVRKPPKKYVDFAYEVRNNLTDSGSDVEIITVSKDDITFSKKKNHVDCEIREAKKESSRTSTPGSDKKRKTLYSFKEKYAEEIDDQSNNNQESSLKSVSETWEEIGANLSKIGSSIGIDISTLSEKKETKKLRKASHSSKKGIKADQSHANIVVETREANIHVTVTECHKEDSSPKNAGSLKPGSSTEAMERRTKLLMGHSSGSGKKSKKKRLSEILPVPRKGKAKRRIIDDSENEDEYESDMSSKRQRQEVEQRGATLFDVHDKSVDIGGHECDGENENAMLGDVVDDVSQSRNNIIQFSKSNNSCTVSENTSVNVQSKQVEGSADSNTENDETNDNLQDKEQNSQENLKLEENHLENVEVGCGRTRRNRRSNVSLDDYIQPTKKIYKKRTEKNKQNLNEEDVVHKDDETHNCQRCQEQFGSLKQLKQHLMVVHSTLWDKACPEGLTDEKSLAIILRKIGKLHCPKCDKELKFMHYYRKHVKWCGREEEKYYCESCEKFIMVMWEHEHNLMHARKDKYEELEKENAAAVTQTEKSSTEVPEGKLGKRSAAKKAEKLLQAISKSYDGIIDLSSDDKDPDAEIFSESSDDDVIFGDYMDEDELEELKVANDSKQMYTGGHFANTFNKNVEYHKEMNRYNNVQFPQFCPRVPEWDPLGENDSKDYLPVITESPEFCIRTNIKQEMDRQKLARFEALASKDYAFLFTGGPVWGLAWVPQPYHTRRQTQYLAVSCHPSMDTLHCVTEATEGSGLIQFWNMGKLNQSLQSMPTPKLEFCIAHDYGVVRRMTWCPFRCWQSKDDPVDEDKMRQMGLLAIACGDGSVRIFSIPDPEDLKVSTQTLPVVFRPTPEVTLVGHKIRRGKTSSCTSLAWSLMDCNNLLGGYGDGSVRIWDLSTTSTLLRVPTPDQGLLLLPFRSFVPHSKTITDLSWSPHSSKYFITCSLDRTVKVWCLDNLVFPQFFSKSSALTAAKWPTIVQSVVYSEDDVYVQQKGHIRLQSYGDLNDKNRANNSPVLAVPTGIWDVSVSDWHLMVFCCDFNGNLVVTYYPSIFGEKKPNRSKLLLCKIHLKPKDTNTQNQPDEDRENEEVQQEVAEPSKKGNMNKKTINSNHRTKDTTHTYMDTVDKYYLEFIEQPTMDRKIQFDENLDLTQFPLTSVYRVEVNPNLESCMFLASGGQSGIVQIHNVNKFLSFHAARDLRQELRLNS